MCATECDESPIMKNSRNREIISVGAVPVSYNKQNI